MNNVIPFPTPKAGLFRVQPTKDGTENLIFSKEDCCKQMGVVCFTSTHEYECWQVWFMTEEELACIPFYELKDAMSYAERELPTVNGLHEWPAMLNVIDSKLGSGLDLELSES